MDSSLLELLIFLTNMHKFIFKKFNELTIDELYDFMKARVDVFVVEQTCPNPELDGEKDKISDHIFSYLDIGEIGAYARIVPAGKSFDEIAIGRIITTENARGTGLGFELMQECIKFIESNYGKQDIRIGAQVYAIPFYNKVGFIEQAGTEYIEDEIPHVEMIYTYR